MAYGMEVNAEKDKIMTNGMNNISADISTNGQKLEEVTTFKYLVATWMAPAQPSTYTFYVRNISSTSKTCHVLTLSKAQCVKCLPSTKERKPASLVA